MGKTLAAHWHMLLLGQDRRAGPTETIQETLTEFWAHGFSVELCFFCNFIFR